LMRGMSCFVSSGRIGVFPSEYSWLRMKFIVSCGGSGAAEPPPRSVGWCFRVLVFERHRMNGTFEITSGLLASGLFCEFGERAGLRREYIDQFAAHGSGNSPKGTECDAVFGFGLFELLDGLPRSVHSLADLALAKAEGLGHRGDPPAGRSRHEAPHELKVSVQLRES